MTLIEAIEENKPFRVKLYNEDLEQKYVSPWLLFKEGSYISDKGDYFRMTKEMMLSHNWEIKNEEVLITQRQLSEVITKAFGYVENPHNQVIDKLGELCKRICGDLGLGIKEEKDGEEF